MNDDNILLTNPEVKPETQREAQIAWNKTQLVQMFIEPESDVYSRVFNRNLQMGNIDKTTYLVSTQKWEVSDWLGQIPVDQGEFIFRMLKDRIINQVNFIYAASNSVDAVGRKSVITNINKQETKDTTQKSGLMNFNKNNNQ